MTRSELVELLCAMTATPGESEGFSELDHALQCAHELALVRPDDIELQIAGLVHDIGHHFGPDEEHGRLGGEQVREALGERVAMLVEAHVPAKRYLFATDPVYAAALSEVSTISLGRQGGSMSAKEADAFRCGPYAADAVVLRRADDLAKVPGRVVAPLSHWTTLLERLNP